MTPGKTDAQNAVSQNDFEAPAEEHRRLAEIGRIVSSTLDLDEALSAFVEQTRSLVPFDRIVINVVNDDLTEFRDLFVDDARPDAPSRGDYLPYRATALASDALENQVEFVANGRDYEIYLEQLRPDQKQQNINGFNSLLLVPLIWQGKAIGTLNLRSTEADAYSDSVISLTKQIGAQIAGAIASYSQRTAIEKELQNRKNLADEQARIAEIGRIVASTLDINEVFDVFAEHAQHLVPWDRVFVDAISDDGSHLIEKFVAGIEIDGPRPPLGALTRDEIYDRVFTEKKPFIEINQTATDSLPPGIRRAESLKVGLKSILVTPLLWKGDVAGVLTFRSTDPAAYNDHHAELALQISQQIAGHIATADQYALLERESGERRRLADEQQRIAEIGRTVSSTLDISEVFAAFADQVQELVPFDRIVASVVSEDKKELVENFVAGISVEESAAGLNSPMPSDELVQRVFIEKKSFVANRLDTLDNWVLSPTEKRRLDVGLRSILITPLLWKGEVEGLLTFRSTNPTAYDDHHTDLALQVARQIAGHIATADQYVIVERQSRERRRLAEERRRIAEIGRIVSSTLEIDEVFESFVEQVSALVSFDRIVVASVSEDRTELVNQFVAGLQMEGSGPGERIPLAKNEVTQRVFVEKKPFLGVQQTMQGYLAQTPEEQPRLDAGLRSMLVTPLLWKGEVEGVLTFRSSKSDGFSEHEAELALQISQQIAGHIATADQYAVVERESEERQRLAEEQSRIAEIGRIVSSALDVQEVLEAFVEQARKLVPIDRIVITSTNYDMTTWTIVLEDGISTDTDRIGIPFQLNSNPMQRKVIAEQSKFVANGKKYEEFSQTVPLELELYKAGLRSILLVPLIWQGRCFGSINLRSVDPEAYGEHEIELAEQISAQIAGAISTSNQYAITEQESEERQRLAEEQSRIAEIGRIVSSTLDVQDVLEAFVEQARALVPIDRIVVTAVDKDMTTVSNILKVGIGVEPDQSATSYPFNHTPVQANVMATQTTFVANRKEYDKYVASEVFETQHHAEGIRAILLVPLVWQGRCFGTMNLRSTNPEAYNEREIALSEQIGAQVAGAISTSNQYAITELESQERQKLAEEQTRIAEIGRIVSSTLDVQEVLEAFVEQARELVPIDRIVITAIDLDLGTMRDILVDGIEISGTVDGSVNRIETDTIQHQVITSQKYYVIAGENYVDLSRHNSVESSRHQAGLRSMLILPLVWQGQCFGTMNLRSTDPDAYGEHEIELAEQIGAQIAGAFATSNQVRLLEAAATAAYTQVAAIEAAGDAIVIRGLDTSIEYINKAYEKQTGYTIEEIGGPNPQYQYIVSLRSDFIDQMWAQVRSGQSVHTTFTGTHRDGTEREYDATLSPIFGDDGKIIKFVGIRRDVTERVRAEEDIQTQAAALNAAGDSVVILAPDTSIEWVNEAFVQDSGYTKEEVIGQRSPFMRSDNDSPDVFDGLWEQVLGGKPWSGRMWVRPKSRDDYQVETSLTPVLDSDGNVSRIIGIRRDITDVIQAEKDREATRDLDAQNQQLLHLNEQREEFFSTVSHELRTPLTSVMAFADILSRNRDGTLSNLQLEHLDVIKRNGRNLNALIEDMLDFSQLSTDRLKLNKSEFEIHSLLDSIAESFEPTVSQRDQSLTIKSNTAPIWITADSGRINQVISNLITNSCKYSPPFTQIAVSAEIDNQRLLVTVTDQGYGIPGDDLEQIFSPFFRADQPEVREEIGTGLGLAISKTLVDLHDGSIEASSKLGEGTEITVILPGATATPATVTES